MPFKIIKNCFENGFRIRFYDFEDATKNSLRNSLRILLWWLWERPTSTPRSTPCHSKSSENSPKDKSRRPPPTLSAFFLTRTFPTMTSNVPDIFAGSFFFVFCMAWGSARNILGLMFGGMPRIVKLHSGVILGHFLGVSPKSRKSRPRRGVPQAGLVRWLVQNFQRAGLPYLHEVKQLSLHETVEKKTQKYEQYKLQHRKTHTHTYTRTHRASMIKQNKKEKKKTRIRKTTTRIWETKTDI